MDTKFVEQQTIILRQFKADHKHLLQDRNYADNPILMSDSTLRMIFNKMCYDESPERPWKFQAPLRNKYYKTPAEMTRRYNWALLMIGERYIIRGAEWYYRNVVYLDPVKFVLPRGPQRVQVPIMNFKFWIDMFAQNLLRW